jgi:hypothetical protein
MISNKTSWSILGLAFIGQVIVSLAGIALLAVLVDEFAEIGWAVPTTFRKALYQFHTSLIVSGVLLVILFTGHAVTSLD